MLTYDDYKKLLEASKLKDASFSSNKNLSYDDYENFVKNGYSKKQDTKVKESTEPTRLQYSWYNSIPTYADYDVYSTKKITPASWKDTNAQNIMATSNAPKFIEKIDKALSPFTGSNTSPFWNMSESERAIYTYLHENPKYGVEKADEYIKALQLSKGMTESYTEKYEDFANDHPVLASLGSTALNVVNGVTQLSPQMMVEKGFDLAQNGFEGYSAYNPENLLSNMATAERNKVTENIKSPVGQFAYQTGMSTIDSLANMLLFNTGATAVMAVNAANARKKELEDAGASPQQVMAGSLLSGGIEYLTEQTPVANFLKAKDIGSVGQFFKEVGKQAFLEGKEEVYSDVLNNIVDLAMGSIGGYSELMDSAKQYEAQGMSTEQAVGHVVGDALKNTALSFAGGALSGGLMGSVGSAMQWHGNAELGSSIASSERVEDLIDQARKAGRNDLADALEKHSNNANIGKAQRELIRSAYEKATAEGATEQDKENYTNAVLDALSNTSSKTGVSDSKGKALHITGIEFENGELKFKTPDGKYKADEINLVDNSLLGLAEFANEIPKEQQKGFAENFREGQDFYDYVLSYERAYLAGQQGHENDLQQLIATNHLDATQAQNIFALGVKDPTSRANKINSDIANINKIRSLVPNKTVRAKINTDCISFDGSDPTKTDWTKLSDNQKKNIAFAEAIARVFNVNVEFFDSTKSDDINKYRNGATSKNKNTIYLDIMATNTISNTTTNAITTTMSHELTHWAKFNAPEVYDVFKEEVLNTLVKATNKALGTDASISAYVKRAKDTHPEYANLTDEEVEDELVARACENMLQNSEYAKEVLSKMDGRSRKSFVDKVREILKKITDVFNEIMGRYDSASNEYKLLASEKEAYQELQKKWDEMIKAATDTSALTNYSIEEGINEGILAEGSTDTELAMSFKTWDDRGKVFLANWLQKQMKNKNKAKRLTQKEYDDIMTGMMNAYDACKELLSKDGETLYKTYDKWQEMGLEVRDGEGDISVIVKNDEYALNIDFTTVCKKREVLNMVLNKLAQDGDLNLYTLTRTDINEINKTIKEHGFEIACGLCYVDAKRYRVGEWAKSFEDNWNYVLYELCGANGKTADEFNFSGRKKEKVTGALISDMKDADTSVLDRIMKEHTDKDLDEIGKIAKLMKEHRRMRHKIKAADIVASDGLDAIRKSNYELYKLVNAHEGVGGMKLAHSRIPYINDILEKQSFNAEAAKKVGGVRIQSFSDFVPVMIFDYVQMISELQAKKLPAQSYTKELTYAKLFGMCGIKINLSALPKGASTKDWVDIAEDGTITIKEGHEEDMKRVRAYTGLKVNDAGYPVDEIGNEITRNYVMTPEELERAVYITDDESIDLDKAIELTRDERYSKNVGVIFVGASSNAIWKMLADKDIHMIIPYHKSNLNPLIAHLRNVASYVDYTTQQSTRDSNGKKLEKIPADIKWYTILDEVDWDARKAAEEYVHRCEDHGFIPMFDEFAYVRDSEGNILKDENGRTRVYENYFKLLEDFRMYDGEGNIAKQEAVKLFGDKGSLNMPSDAFKNEDGSDGFFTQELAKYDENIQALENGGLDNITKEIRKTLRKTHGRVKKDTVMSSLKTDIYEFSDDDFSFGDAELAYLDNDFDVDFTPKKKSDINISDKAYLDLIDNGKTKEAREILDSIARKHGALSLPNKGNPTLFYHGTRFKRFHAFDISKSGNGWSGIGFYFTPDKAFAKQYASGEADMFTTYLFPKNLAYQGKHKITTEKLTEFLESVNVSPTSDEAYTTFLYHSGEVFSDKLREFKNGMYGKWDIDTFTHINDDREILIALEQLLDHLGYSEADTVSKLRDFFGYDGVSNARETVVWFPNEIKSAELIDYDDNAEVVPLSERFNEEQDDIRYSVKDNGQTYVFKEDFLEDLLDNAGWTAKSNPNYAHAYIAYVSPDKFLKLTTGKNPERIERIKDWSTGEMQDKTPYDFNKMEDKFTRDNVFYLELDNEGANVIGHNGRHRMWQLKQMGVRRVPVLVFDTRESEKYTKDVRDLMVLPQEFDEYDDKLEFDDFTTIKDAVPFNRKYWDTIKRWFTDDTTMSSVKTNLTPEDLAEWKEAGFSEDEVKRMLPQMASWDALSEAVDKSGLTLEQYFYNKVHANAPYKWTGFDNMKHPSHWSKAYAKTHTETHNEYLDMDEVIETHPKQVQYIGRTIDALDTDIDWSWLTIVYKANVGDDCVGEYTPERQEIAVEPNLPNSLAHEMGHALDHRWGMDISGFDSYLTDVKHSYDSWTKEQKAFYKHFKSFMASLKKSADKSSDYLKTPTEIFARFVEEFVPWTEVVSTGHRTMFEGDGVIASDYFTAEQYEDFVRLLEEKAAMDEENEVMSSFRDTSGNLHVQESDFLSFEDYADFIIRSSEMSEKEKAKARQLLKGEIKEGLKAERDKARAMYREKYEKALAQIRQEYQEAERNIREGARRDRLIKKILERTNVLATKYNKHDKRNHIPEPLREAFANLFTSLNMTEGLPKGRLLNNFNTLIAKLNESMPDESKAMEDVEQFFGYDPYFVSQIQEIVDELNAKVDEFTEGRQDTVTKNVVTLNDLSTQSLKKLNETLIAISHAIRSYDEALGAEKKARISEAANTTINFVSQKVPMAVKNYVQNLATSFFGWDNITPIYGYDRFGEGGKQIFREFIKGDDKNTANEIEIIDNAKKYFTPQEMREWNKKTLPVTIGGKEYKMTIAQIMSLYELNKRQAAQQHLYNAKNIYGKDIEGKGIFIGEIEKTQSLAKVGKITRAEVDEITSKLTDHQKEVADGLQQFLATRCADWGNYVTMMRYGIMQFGEKDYFPMDINGDPRKITVKEDNKQTSLFKLLNMGFTNSLNPNANGELIVSSIFDVYIKHASEMAAYNAYALPVLDTMKWLNYREKTDDGVISLKSTLKDAYGSDALDFIINHIRDVNGQREEKNSYEKFTDMIVRNYKTAATAANLRVVVMQPTAYLRAFNCIDGKYLIRALSLNPLSIKKAMDEMNDKSMLAKRKNGLGAFDANLSRTVEEQISTEDGIKGIKDYKSFKTKALDASLKLAQKMDEITWSTLYKAVQIEMREKTDLKGDAFDAAVTDRFEDICYRTQVFDSINARSELMRSKDRLTKLATAFMSEPTLSYSMMANEVFMFMVDARGGNIKQSWSKHCRKIGRAFVAFMMTAVAVSAVAALPDWLRDDDDETPFLEMYFKDFGMNMLAESMGLLPWIKTIHSAFIEGYNPSRPDEDVIVSAKNAGMSIVKSIEDRKLSYRAIYRTAKLFSQMTGTPLGNVIRDFVAMWNKTFGEMLDMKIE